VILYGLKGVLSIECLEKVRWHAGFRAGQIRLVGDTTEVGWGASLMQTREVGGIARAKDLDIIQVNFERLRATGHSAGGDLPFRVAVSIAATRNA
jgi:hypothetical protein